MPTPSWDKLRSIGNSRAVKLTSLIPLIGYLILFNEHVVSLLHLDKSLLGGIAENFLTSRLRLLYFGLFTTGVGALLYMVFCPMKIKQYADAVEFAQRELHFLPLPYFYSLVRDLSHLRNPDYAGIDIDQYTDHLATHENGSLDAIKIQILTEWYWSRSLQYPVIRWAAFIFFAVGFFLLFYPSVEALVRILWETL
jgi:hypothetical protein